MKTILVAACISAVSTIAAAAEFPIEAPIVPQAIALAELGRYRSNKSFDETAEFYERLFRRVGGVRWHNVINLPGIKAKHIESQRKQSDWEGINIYEYQNEVRIFVIPRAKSGQDRPQRSKSRASQ
jgi:hypothetical protein